MHSLAVFGYSLLLRCSASNIQGTEGTEKRSQEPPLNPPREGARGVLSSPSPVARPSSVGVTGEGWGGGHSRLVEAVRL